MHKHHFLIALAALGLLVLDAGAQTQVDLRTQSKSVDFSAAQSTKPAKTGTVLPATCSSGEFFYKTDAAAGQNVYACTSSNTWTVQGGGGGSSLPPMTSNADKLLSNNGVSADWRALGGDIAGAPQAAAVQGLRGRAVSATAPSDGEVLGWVAGLNSWAPIPQPLGSTAGLADCRVSRATATQLTVAAPCNVLVGVDVSRFLTSATVTVSGTGSGTARIGMNFSTLPPALRIVTGGLAIACAGMGCTTAAGAAFDNATIPLATWSATSGTWDTSGGTDLRSVVSQARILPGSGLQEVIVAGAKTLSVDPAVVPFYFSATATIDFALLAAGACANQTFPVTGAASGDAVAVGWPASLEAGLLGAVFVSAANTVTVRLCNLSGAPLDPASHTFRATIVRAL